jgi:formate hydrogenlyase subunit 6/NADH:ubiquinone oxidoreductase subunit I
MCGRRCPTYAITVTKDSKEWQIDRLQCCTCDLCVEICPVKCLFMENQYTPPITDRGERIYTVKKEESVSSEQVKDK